MIHDIYTVKEKREVKESLLKQQAGNCLITKEHVTGSSAVLDHRHDDSCMVRGVLHRQVNSCVGVIENSWKRYMAWWYKGTLPDFLRSVALYLEREDALYRHDAWIKRVNIEFNKLPEALKRAVLKELGQPEGGNGAERKKLFQRAVLSRQFTFEGLKKIIERVKT